ncbi:hypothetical protein U1Q18_038516 [Sarracenia purpurea var. burkii]
MKGVTFALLVVMVTAAMVQFMTKPSEAAITCGQVDAALTPCIVYLTRGGTHPMHCVPDQRRHSVGSVLFRGEKIEIHICFQTRPASRMQLH